MSEFDKKGAQTLFEEVFSARGDEREELLKKFVRRYCVRDILDVSLSQFKERGNQDRLALVGEMLYAAGEGAFRELKHALEAGMEEAEYFTEQFAEELKTRTEWEVDEVVRAVDELFSVNSRGVRSRIGNRETRLVKQLQEENSELKERLEKAESDLAIIKHNATKLLGVIDDWG